MRSKKSQLALKRAHRWFQGAQRSLEDERWDDVIYGAQMAVEQAIKSIMLDQGYVFKRVHDVSDEFLRLENQATIPKWFRDVISEIIDILTHLSDQRALAGYGFEEEIGVEYFEPAAKPALNAAEKVLSYITRLHDEQIK